MCLHDQGPVKLTAAQNRHQLVFPLDYACTHKSLRSYLRTFAESRQPLQINRRELNPPWVSEAHTSSKRELPYKRQLSAFEVR
jgi:hypothetical protein